MDKQGVLAQSNESAQTVHVADGELPFDQNSLGWMKESNDLLDDVPALHKRLAEDGYLFIRGLLPEEVVTGAFEAMAGVLKHLGLVSHVENKTDLVASDAMMALASLDSSERDKADLLEPSDDDGGKLDIMELAAEPTIARMLQADELYKFYARLFGEEATTFDYKWVRPVPPGEFTGFHVDNVYMGNGSNRVHTTWMPLVNVDFELGVLVVLEGSNSLPAFKRIRETYGQYDVDAGDIRGLGWLTSDPKELLAYGSRFVTSQYRPGDVVIFPTQTLHGSLKNTSERRLRLSCDVRFQPAGDPTDPRWMKPNPGHRRFAADKRHDPKHFPRSMETAKREWGLGLPQDLCKSNADTPNAK